MAAGEPPLQGIDHEQQHKGNAQHDQRNGRGALLIILIKLGKNDQRGNFRHHRNIAGDEHDGPEFAGGTGKCQSHTGQQGRKYRREHHPAHGLPATGPQTGRRFFQLLLQIVQHRLHGAHHKRQTDKGQGDHDAQRRKRHLDPPLCKELAKQAIRCIQRGQGNTGNGRRQGERQIHHGIHHPLARKGITHQHPGYQGAEHGIDQSGNGRGHKRQPQGGQYPIGANGVPECCPAHRHGG